MSYICTLNYNFQKVFTTLFLMRYKNFIMLTLLGVIAVACNKYEAEKTKPVEEEISEQKKDSLVVVNTSIYDFEAEDSLNYVLLSWSVINSNSIKAIKINYNGLSEPIILPKDSLTYKVYGVKKDKDIVFEISIIDTRDVESDVLNTSIIFDFELNNISKDIYRDNSEIMFLDSEPQEVLLSREKRGFYLDKMISIKKLEDGEYLIANFVPKNFNDVTLYATIPGIDEEIKVLTFDEIPGHSKAKWQLLKYLEEEEYETISGKYIYLEDINDTENATFRLDCEDIVFKKIKEIKMTTFIFFNDYSKGGTDAKWTHVEPHHARDYTAMMANYGYFISTNEFHETFMNYPYQIFNNSGYGNPIDREFVYNKLLRFNTLRLGVLKENISTVGLAGGATYGLRGSYVFNVIKEDGSHDAAGSHELGHNLGFTHSSNMTSSIGGRGFANDMFATLYRSMRGEKGRFPIEIESYMAFLGKKYYKTTKRRSNVKKEKVYCSCGTEL